MTMNLTKTDKLAIERNDDCYINSKGANLYCKSEFKDAVEYYHLAAAMGNVQAISNLGYCYLYGRDIPQNIDLGIAYFKIAAAKGNIDANYKLGDIYSRDKYVKEDKELAIYYYRNAASFIIDEWDKHSIMWNDELETYPSLCFALGRETMPNGDMNTDCIVSYAFLLKAKKGYEKYLNDGDIFYKDCYKKVVELLDDRWFNSIKKEFEDDDLFS